MVIGAIIRLIITVNIILFDRIFNAQQKTEINTLRGIFIICVKFAYVNILMERAVATKFSSKYQEHSLFGGVFVLAVWWVICGGLGAFEQILFTIIASLILPFVSLYLMEKWNKHQYHSLPEMSKSLSSRYQIVENIRTLRMFRRWSYFFIVVILLETITLFSNYAILLPRGMVYEWRLVSNIYDLLFASYTLVCPLLLIKSHPHLQFRFEQLLNGTDSNSALIKPEIGRKYIQQDDFDAYFQRLNNTWQKHGLQ
ncbi:unnamed protein product [Bursaphelenchus okinawaensis]|uniref:Uncharacterized protein n=1 Tax=Bursaphelenchus okinawaensis TaxID=465554 RepID=A0A811K685_9BILA|nr:unnamed protein product [Bursaphelenchus okinawaensis]CAG9092248.1 unnamed protein product [Bursaphelenchus okinawaensis]